MVQIGRTLLQRGNWNGSFCPNKQIIKFILWKINNSFKIKRLSGIWKEQNILYLQNGRFLAPFFVQKMSQKSWQLFGNTLNVTLHFAYPLLDGYWSSWRCWLSPTPPPDYAVCNCKRPACIRRWSGELCQGDKQQEVSLMDCLFRTSYELETIHTLVVAWKEMGTSDVLFWEWGCHPNHKEICFVECTCENHNE